MQGPHVNTSPSIICSNTSPHPVEKYLTHLPGTSAYKINPAKNRMWSDIASRMGMGAHCYHEAAM